MRIFYKQLDLMNTLFNKPGENGGEKCHCGFWNLELRFRDLELRNFIEMLRTSACQYSLVVMLRNEASLDIFFLHTLNFATSEFFRCIKCFSISSLLNALKVFSFDNIPFRATHTP